MDASKDDENYLEVDTPFSLLPDLTLLGIEEVDRGICEDTSENRRILRANKMRFREVFNSDGTLTDLIQAISSEMRDNHALDRKAAVLSKPRDVNSEYLTGIDLLLETDIEEHVPAWVLAATRKWVEVDKRRRETGKRVLPSVVGPPARCGYTLMNGSRCLNWHNGTASVAERCTLHRARANSNGRAHILSKARNRVASNLLVAVDELEKLMLSAGSEQVKLKATTEMMDRGGLRGGVEIDQNVTVEVKPAREIVLERLAKLQRGIESEPGEPEAIEAEVVPDDE
jgi:hypothetical protein